MTRYAAGAWLDKQRPAAVLARVMTVAVFSLPLIGSAQAFPGGVARHHDFAAGPDSASAAFIRTGACQGRDCDPPPPEPREPPCRKWEPYSHGRSNIGLREMWELITHGAPMPGTDYYYYRMYEYRDGRIFRPRRCGS